MIKGLCHLHKTSFATTGIAFVKFHEFACNSYLIPNFYEYSLGCKTRAQMSHHPLNLTDLEIKALPDYYTTEYFLIPDIIVGTFVY